MITTPEGDAPVGEAAPAPMAYEVRAQLTPHAAVVGVWDDRRTAARKYAEWVERYGSGTVTRSW
ncbi:hypothetical protein QMK19_35215 [Streptomyces sp. H10-C2]|uniref:hypothetical protein n=1 Tax=unclassified Streptomyces TaxID=2593676 RepID=UPI0024BA62D5|nr:MULTISPECIES: hypothetical protein [unclassified Streptomyces]MDJ0345885.1 hypothetical protein [Streptomyces sp. PH10-H1]MDJ0374734.1 hypothetical protein [Streptomyces sp. H10-C2]